jgi:hypothetical protein
MPNPRHEGSHAPTLGDIGAPRGKCGFRCHPDASLPWLLIEKTHIFFRLIRVNSALIVMKADETTSPNRFGRSTSPI